MRVLIVDDEEPARAKLRRWLSAEEDVEIAGEAADGPAAARAIGRLSPQVVFLDIQIPEMDGLTLVNSLPGSQSPLIVFVTAHDQYAVPAFDADAADYLLKPYDRQRFARSLNRVRQRLAAKRPPSPERLQIPVGNHLRLVDKTAVIWLEADDNYVRLHTRDGAYFLRSTMHALLKQLGEDRFARIHKSRAVNTVEIATLKPLPHGDVEIAMKEGTVLRASRRFRKALFAKAAH
jgi:two-component system LytT family response regulator